MDKCIVKECKNPATEGDYFCPKHRRKFEKAKARGTDYGWLKTNVGFVNDEIYFSKG